MWCTKCEQQLSKCDCPDLEDRLKKLSESSHLAMKWCAKCNKHYSFCICEEPDWTITGRGL